MPQTYDEVNTQLAPIFDPQTQLINDRVAALPGEYAPQYSALDQAKINAFKSIDNTANARGMLFSGFTPDQQATYVGTKYLPARAALASQQQQQEFTLKDQLNKIQQARAAQVEGTISSQAKNEQDAAYKDAQLQLEYAKLNSSNSNAAASRALSGAGKVDKSAVANHIVGQFNTNKGRDGKVSNETWLNALNDWTTAGGTVRQFWQNYGTYVNPKYAGSYAGYTAR